VPPTAGSLRVGRYFAVLIALLAVLYAIVFWPGTQHTPKLGLDLEGGTQVVLTASTPNGKAPSKSSMNLARQIIESRVNGLGVASAEVVIEGSDRIVVSVPGKNGNAVRNVGKPFQLNFRPLMLAGVAVTPPASSTPSASASATASSTAGTTGSATPEPSATSTAPKLNPASSSPAGQGRVAPKIAAAGTSTPATAAASASKTPATATPSATPSPSAGTSVPANTAGGLPVDQWAAYRKQFNTGPPTNEADYTALPTSDPKNGTAKQQAVQDVLNNWDCNNANLAPLDTATEPLVSCSEDGTAKYLLGSVIVPGTQIKSASAVAPGSQQGQLEWSVNVDLKPAGQKAWAKYTAAHNAQATPGDLANQVAYTLDSKVVSQPSEIQETITGTTQITGGFTSQQATDLANALKYGALPLNFTTQDVQTVSPTLGTAQLKAGLLAGGIGLILVVIYSLLYYRALGLVTIASLLVSGLLTYAMLVILGRQIGFTLTLAGIAGFIVAIGITADSFVVFFERIKDEVHEGRTSRVAVPRAWERARRTILSADAVSFLAAATLYYFAAGDVKGFAFTLGLSTILDLVVVFLFTHPIVSLFSRSAAFGSARFTGLDHVRVAGMPSYRSSLRNRPGDTSGTSGAESDTELEADPDTTSGDPADVVPADGPAPATATVSHGPSPAADQDEDAAPVGAGSRTSRGSSSNAPAGQTAPAARGSTAAERAAARRAAQRDKSAAGTDNDGTKDTT
jgi:preprotein translocase subunit SecD